MYRPKLTRIEADRRIEAVKPFLAMGMSKTQACEKAGFSISSLMRAERFIRKSNASKRLSSVKEMVTVQQAAKNIERELTSKEAAMTIMELFSKTQLEVIKLISTL